MTPKRAVTFEVIDATTQDTVASYDDRAAAINSLERLISEDPTRADALSLVSFDAAGHAISSSPAAELVAH